ncbi:nitronate monooxygenase family protein [Sphingobium sp. H39-3-25]|uniref:NAD(P)H-dependent flavin oxidoreductase n=1 Tax=Sphingobium arseniciresistens TaxID=3030834 RepID=UPI0023B8A46E|nr:nitronate monooxygenase family protein [Sphingobium arseniciresistens]
MTYWPDDRITTLFGIDLPIILAPMAGPVLAGMVIAVAQQGGLGSLPCALLDGEQVDAELTKIRAATACPVNLNFFCHAPAPFDPAGEAAWRERLRPYYIALGLDPDMPVKPSHRAAFDEASCARVEKWRPEVVSFHFGLPAPALLARVRATGAKIISSATTVQEALWLEAQGCDAIIAQGAEAGGHRGMFLTTDVSSQIGTMALLPQVVDAVQVPVIAAGGIADARGIVAALALGASAVQIGTAYLHCPEAKLTAIHRQRLISAQADETAITNLFTGRPARGILNRLMREQGPLSHAAPAFPLAGGALAPLRAASEPVGSDDFTPLWAGQAFPVAHRPLSASALTQALWAETRALLGRMGKAPG